MFSLQVKKKKQKKTVIISSCEQNGVAKCFNKIIIYNKKKK